MSASHYPLTRQQKTKLREDLSAVEELLQGIAVLMRACHGEDSQVTIRADEMLCGLQRFSWELERVQENASAAGGEQTR
jgi:hypothetical protein